LLIFDIDIFYSRKGHKCIIIDCEGKLNMKEITSVFENNKKRKLHIKINNHNNNEVIKEEKSLEKYIIK